MKLFFWDECESFRDCFPGYCLAIAETADEAREKIIKGAKDEGYCEDLLRVLVEDLKAEPKVVEHALIWGSQ